MLYSVVKKGAQVCVAASLFFILACGEASQVSSNPGEGNPPPGSPTGAALFFSDLESGPKTGGQNNKGAFVTVYGKGFGATQESSYVTVGGGKADNYPLWSDTKITFQLGANAATGNIVVVTSEGNSNGLPFTVRSGNIYFVSTSGNDSNSGSYSAPWRTIVKAKNSLAAGDIAYVMSGVAQTSVENYSSFLAISSAGSASAPKALVAYPGAQPIIGATSGAEYSIRNPQVGGGANYWVIAGFLIRGLTAIDLWQASGWRIVGNEITCPNGGGPTACVHTDTTTNTKLLGNYVHDTGINCGRDCKLYHAVYFSTNSNNIEVGWNEVAPRGGCRGVQFYSTSGSAQYGLSVHDNIIHDTVCDGLNFSTVNPANGTVEAYNNIIYAAGKGPDPSGEGSNYSCINIDGTGTTDVEIYNNSLYDCGARGGSDAGALSIYRNVNLRNNIVRQLSNETYFPPNDGSCGYIRGDKNIWFGAGNAPSCGNLNNNLNQDPKYVGEGTKDFRLQTGSPGIDAGSTTKYSVRGIEGQTRPQGAAVDIGAYER